MAPNNKKQALTVYPAKIEVDAVEPDVEYVVKVEIQNHASTVRRIRISHPKTKFFKVCYEPSGRIAPGLSMFLEVQFTYTAADEQSLAASSNSGSDEGSFFDSITLACEDCSVEVPLKASKPCGKITFDNFANLGIVAMSSKAAVNIDFVNRGHREGHFSISYDSQLPIKISPSEGEIPPITQAPNNRVAVCVQFEPAVLGDFRTLAVVRASGSIVDRVLDISATVVEQALCFQLGESKAKLSSTPFGTLFYGEKKSLVPLLVNNGPKPAIFRIHLSTDDESEMPSTNREGEGTQTAQPPPALFVSPRDGVIQPYSSIPITFLFAPQLGNRDKGFKVKRQASITSTNYEAVASLSYSDSAPALEVPMSGKAVPLLVSVDIESLDFGTCPTNDRRDHLISIKNEGEFPVDYNINKIPFFSVNPLKGKLQPLQTQKAVVSFIPSQLGVFKNTIHVVFNKGLFACPIRVSGTAEQLGDKKPKIGGKDALPEDFNPKLNFVAKDATPLKKTQASFTRPLAWETAEFVPKVDTVLTYSVENLIKQHDNRQNYQQFLKQSRLERERATSQEEEKRKAELAKRSQDPNDTLSLGLEPQSDMHGPIPKPPSAVDKLWLQAPVKGYGGEGGEGAVTLSSGKLNQMDENRLIKKKFKAKPGSPAEVKDCASTLKENEIKLIQMGPKCLSYGRISTGSINKKSFFVINGHRQHILFELLINCNELEQTTPRSQVIPPGATAGFDIILVSSVEQSFAKPINCLINGQHNSKFVVQAEIVPVTVSLSTKELIFSFNDDNVEPSVSRSVTLTNPGNSPCDYKWEGHEQGVFKVSPVAGSLGPGATKDTVITFVPTPGQKYEKEIALKVSGGKEEKLKCTGIAEEPKLIIKEKNSGSKIDLGVFAVGEALIRSITVKNLSSSPTVVFSQMMPQRAGLTLTQPVLKLQPSETAEVEISILLHSPCKVEDWSVVILGRGGKPFKLPIAGNAIMPTVEMVPSGIAFGSVAVGGTHREMVHLHNKSDVGTSLLLDLSGKLLRDFCVISASEMSSGALRTAGGDADSRSSCSIIPISQITPDLAATFGAAGRSDSSSEESLQLWRIDIPPQSSAGFYLMFRPTRIDRYRFDLPFYLLNVGPYPALRKPVSAEATKPYLLLSSKVLDFGDCVMKKDMLKPSAKILDFYLTCDDEEPLRWEIDVSSILSAPSSNSSSTSTTATSASKRNAIFTVAPTSGVLAPGDKVILRATFSPQALELYSVFLPVLINDHDKKEELTNGGNAGNNASAPPLSASMMKYMEIELTGRGIYPKMDFSEPHIVLPLVPLFFRSVQSINVLNIGYENMEIQYRLPVDSTHAPLSVSFPLGRTMGIGNPTLPVDVGFVAVKPLGCSTKIDFFDPEGNVFSIPVYATGDNCVLTLAPFIDAHKEQLEFVAIEGKAVILMDKKHARQLQRKQEAAQAPNAPGQATSEAADTGYTSANNNKTNSAEITSTNYVRLRKQSIDLRSMEMKVDCSKIYAMIEESEFLFLIRWCHSTFLQSKHAVGGRHEVTSGAGTSGDVDADIPVTASQFIATCVGNHGKFVLDSVEQLYGKPIPNRPAKFSSSRNEMIKQLVGQYRELLAILKALGGLCHETRPEYFLGKDQFAHYLLSPSSGSNVTAEGVGAGPPRLAIPKDPVSRQHFIDALWSRVSILSWSTLLYQIVRVFILHRVTPKSLSNLPGYTLQESSSTVAQGQEKRKLVGSSNRGSAEARKAQRHAKDEPDALSPIASMSDLENSNVYTISEGVLLRWLSFHVNNVCSGISSIRIVTFDTDLRNASVLCCLFKSHIPSLASVSGPLAGFHLNPKDDEQCARNARQLIEAMAYLRMDISLDPEHILKLKARDGLLLTLYLFLTLPQYVPKTTIEFSGALGVPIRKSIELRNPSNQNAIVYDVKLEGSSDFQLTETSITLPANGESKHFDITLNARFSTPVDGRLTFFPRHGHTHGTWALASVLVFDVRSQIHSRQSHRNLKISTSCYESVTTEIDVINPFPGDAFVTITLVQECLSGPGTQTSATAGRVGTAASAGSKRRPSFRKTGAGETLTSSTGGGPLPSSGNTGKNNHTTKRLYKDEEDASRKPFHCRATSLRLRQSQANSSAVASKILLDFLPLSPGEYRCQLIFIDPSVGEFVYEILATATSPKPVETLSFESELSEQISREIFIPTRNSALIRSQQQLLERLAGAAKTKAREQLKLVEDHGFGSLAMLHSVSVSGETASPSSSSPVPVPGNSVLLSNRTYSVEVVSPFFKCSPERIILSSAWAASSGSGKNSKSNQHMSKLCVLSPPAAAVGSGRDGEETTARPKLGVNVLQLSLNPKTAGTYRGVLALRCIEDPTDHRVFEIEATVTSAPLTTKLRFSNPARQILVQDIPIVNAGSKDWVLSASLSGGEAFSGPLSVTVPAGQKVMYPLSFRPSWVGSVQGRLTLTNEMTGDLFEYDIDAVGEDPLALDHIEISCPARQTTTQNIAVKNYRSEVAVFRVESDLPHVSGASTIELGPRETKHYALCISPQISGTYTGSLTFTDEVSGEYQWYTVEVDAATPAPESILEVHAICRKAMVVDICLSNPIDDTIEFEVELLGSGLIGESRFTLEGQQSSTYELIYHPLLPGAQTGSIVFRSDRVGEFWYKLQLSAEKAPVIVLPPMACPLGRVDSQIINLDNPSSDEVLLTPSISNKKNYTIQQPHIRLRPYGQAEVRLYYNPSSMSEEESSTIAFSHPSVGEWVYAVKGTGMPPGEMDTLVISSTASSTATENITFTNVLKQMIKIEALLEASSPEAAQQLSLLLRQTKRELAPGALVRLPILFAPKRIGEVCATVLVSAEENLIWRYPIRGISEAPAVEEAWKFKCRARQPLTQTIEVKLQGIEAASSSGFEEFEEVVLVVPEEFQRLVDRSLFITPLQQGPADITKSLQYEVVFQPLKPFATTIQMIVGKKSGGRWRFGLRLEATEAAVDDVLTIEAAMQSTSSLAFRLSNFEAREAEFKAEFTATSSIDFTVYPSRGTLPPLGVEGVNFLVSYTPSEYGKQAIAKMLISTDEMQWVYEIRGKQPHYSPPKGKSKIDNQLPLEIARRLHH